MMRLFFVITLCLIAAAASGQAADIGPSSPGQARRSIAERSDYNPYLIQAIEKGLADDAMALWKEGRQIEATEKVRELLRVFPVSLIGHRMMRDIFELTAEAEQDPAQKAQATHIHQEHKAYLTGLFDAILSAGDGLTPGTAYWVVTISEEYFLLSYLGYAVKGRRLIEQDGKRFDVFEVQDGERKDRLVFFDVTHFRLAGAR